LWKPWTNGVTTCFATPWPPPRQWGCHKLFLSNHLWHRGKLAGCNSIQIMISISFHAPRKDNFAVDALSHRPDYVIASDNPSLSAYGTWIRAHLHAVPQKQISKSVTLGPAAALAPSWLLLGASQPRSGHRAAKNTPWLPLAMTPLILSTAFQSEIFWFLQQALWKQLVMQDTLRHFRLPRVLVSERDPRFTSNFWKALCKRLGTSLNISTSHHPQTGGQTKCANRTNEDMLRAYVSPQQSDWHEHLIAA